MDFQTADPDVDTFEDVVETRYNDGGFILTRFGDLLFGRSHQDIVMEFQAELGVSDADYERVVRNGGMAMEDVMQKLLRQGNIYIRLFGDTWIIMVNGLNSSKKNLIYDWAKEMVDAGANPREDIELQDLRVSGDSASLTLGDLVRFDFGESLNSSGLARSILSLINEMGAFPGGFGARPRPQEPPIEPMPPSSRSKEQEDFDAGKDTCRLGKPAPPNATPAFLRGYETESGGCKRGNT